MQASYSGSNRSVKYLFENATEVSVEQILTSGTPVATITVDGDDVDLYAPAGGGSDVVANPVGTPTDDLDTIEIDGVIYDIPGSGGGSTNYGKFTCDLLFVNDPLPPVQDCRSGLTKNYTLTKSIDDYDAVYFVALTSYQTQGATNDDCVKTIVLKQDFYNPSNTVIVSSFTDGRYLQIVFTSDTAIQTIAYASQSFYCPTLYKVYGLKFENKLINRSDIYSEEERMIGRWTDGKPLYQKTIKNIGVTLQQNTWTNTGIPFTGIDNWEVIFNKSNTSNYDNQYPMLYRFYNGNFQAFCQYTMPLDELTIQYTKTTDQPNSGFLPEDPQMVMISDYYSENEQVVGRWTDGKPIYQKTYLLGSGVYITNNGISISSYLDNLSTYDQIIDAVGYGKNNNDARADSLYLNTTGMAYCAEGMTTNHVTVRYTKTTDIPGTGPTKGNLIYLPALYSEEEREVGVWTDGKPLYQKTFLTNWTSNGEYHIDVTSLSINNFIYVEGFANRYDVMEFSEEVNVNFVNNVNSYRFLVWYNRESEYLRCLLNMPENRTSRQSITIRYTKTTDQPGSGTWTPDGQYAHHYSTSEKVVGTWIDGNTLYEKTINFGSLPNNTTKTVSSGLSNISIQQIFGVARASNGFTVTLPHREISGSGNIDIVYQSDNYIRIITDYDYSGFTAYVTLQYTKSS